MATVTVPPPATEIAWRPADPLLAASETRRLLLIAAWCGFLFFYGIRAGELWRTENLRAIIAAEFLRSGNWVVPALYGEPLFTKPPGMYAAIALVSWPLGGVTEWTARLPSALGATACVLLFYWYFRRHFGPTVGLIAAAILPTSFMWLDKATTAEIDTLQVFWATASILFFLRALEAEESTLPHPHTCCSPGHSVSSSCAARWWLLALLCVAGGVLTKWTAPAFFYLTVIPLLWWRGRLRLLWGWRHLASVAVAAGVCLAWIAAAATTTGWDVFHETVSREAIQRLSHAHHAEALRVMTHHKPLLGTWAEKLAHPFVLWGCTLPWSIAALWTLWPGFTSLWNDRERPVLQAMHCWTWPSVLFWSLIPEHAPRHSFPLFPGIAGLAILVWAAWLTGRWRWPIARLRARSVFIGTLVVWLGVKLAFVHAVIPHRNRDREPRAKGRQLAALVPDQSTLYLFRLKDEGIMFYYGRPVRRLASPAQLPWHSEPMYCILEQAEWEQWSSDRPAEAILRLRDEQGAPIVLVRVGSESR
jgi:4-amino-4-deoxy-L-arabinose transferase-like glycosyltransferase